MRDLEPTAARNSLGMIARLRIIGRQAVSSDRKLAFQETRWP